MRETEPTVEQFLKDVSGHGMTVLHRDGLYRHIHFQSTAKSRNRWFDLVTWPGNLTIRGDMGTWTFSRVEDMFTFFRSSRALEINASYWAEKIQGGANGGTDAAKVYEEDVFKEDLLNQLRGYYGFEGSELEDITQAVKDEVFQHEGDKYQMMISARDFEHTFQDGNKFHFDMCELPDGRVYSYHFVWCLYAIVWGIQQWDAAQALAA